MKHIIILLSLVFAIALANGQHTKAFQKKNILKTTFLSFNTGSTKLTYERALCPGQSIELTAGYIGIGRDGIHKNHPKGGLCRLAYKFIFFNNPDYPLNGFYVKPEFAMSAFKYNTEGPNSRRARSTMGTLMCCVGYQWAKRIFIAEGFVGAGAGLGKPADTNYQHGFITCWDWLTLTFGAKIGVMF